MVNSFFKNVIRLFTKHKARFLTIAAIVIVSVGFAAGVGEVENKISAGVDNIYLSQNVSDLYLKSKNPLGFNSEEIYKLEQKFGSKNLQKSFCYEEKLGEENYRFYYFDFENLTINKPEMIEGRLPKEENEIAVERSTSALSGYNVGEKVSLKNPFTQQFSEYIVVGVTLNPLVLQNVEETSFAFEGEEISKIIYFNSSFIPIVNDVYVANENRELFDSFSKEYKEEITALKEQVISLLGEDSVSPLSLYENFGLYSLIEYATKVALIGIIFVVFFLLVALLVVYSTMSRLLDEERAQIACMRTLGYTDAQILFKYALFVFLGTLIGGLCAFAVGIALTKLLYEAFHLQYHMPPFPKVNYYLYYFATLIITLISSTLLTVITGLRAIKKKPVELLQPKAPKHGKKVLIERIPLIWNRLSFKYKSTVRNVFLFKSRFLMTVISIIGSTVLVFSGLGLMDSARNVPGGDSLITIALALLVFSAILCALVVYNITNINVSERNREIATLMVLGYKDSEVCGYINREVYIMSVIAALLGLPLGYFFLDFVFGVISFGSVGDINWWTYIIAPVLTVIYSFIATLLLRHKIIKTDMNASLKSIE